MNLKQLNILLADDDADDCFFFRKALEVFPLSTPLVVVHDGEQLMQLLSNEANELPDVLFLDLNMPRKNGFECLSEMRLSEKLKHLPVIVFSTSFEQEVINQLYLNGALYFIRKPSEFSQYKKIIIHALTLIAEGLPVDANGNILQPVKEKFVLTVQNSEDQSTPSGTTIKEK
jgi:CheY-like chemotaxis protein